MSLIYVFEFVSFVWVNFYSPFQGLEVRTYTDSEH
jgi:hypothetical protein